jgi:hypothetical protein
MFRTAEAKFAAVPFVGVVGEPWDATTLDGSGSPAGDLLRETPKIAKPSTATIPTR